MTLINSPLFDLIYNSWVIHMLSQSIVIQKTIHFWRAAVLLVVNVNVKISNNNYNVDANDRQQLSKVIKNVFSLRVDVYQSIRTLTEEQHIQKNPISHKTSAFTGNNYAIKQNNISPSFLDEIITLQKGCKMKCSSSFARRTEVRRSWVNKNCCKNIKASLYLIMKSLLKRICLPKTCC